MIAHALDMASSAIAGHPWHFVGVAILAGICGMQSVMRISYDRVEI